jgi:hypothetical protein
LTNATVLGNVTSVGQGIFYGCATLQSVVFGASGKVKSITDGMFYGCASLTGITIPEGATGIGSNAFYGCVLLASVTIPEGVAGIGSNVFYGCVSLESITIPESVKSIGDYAFDGCVSLRSVTVLRRAVDKDYKITTLGGYAFRSCPLEVIYVQNDVDTLEGYRIVATDWQTYADLKQPLP